MPVKLGSKLPPETEARIEIIPLIDIMFFLLAAFMLVSLTMVNLKTVKLNLPTATTASPEVKRDFIKISVDQAGVAYLDTKPVGDNELAVTLSALLQTNAEPRVLISGDRACHHGDVMRVLDVMRSTGIQKVAFEVREQSSGSPLP